MRRTEILIFALIMAVAIGVRLYGLSWAPPGLSPDESMNGNNAITALRTNDFKLFYPENGGREGLFINLQAVSVRYFGNTSQALRQVSALIGILTILGVYLLARRMFDDWRTAAIATFLMSVGFWHINFSRIGLHDIMVPLCAVWGFYYLYKGIETHRVWHWALAGAWFGLGFYATISFWAITMAVALTFGAYWLSLRTVFSHEKYAHARQQMLGGAAALAGAMILVLLPMTAYFPAGTQEIANSATVIAANAVKTLGMFFTDKFVLFLPVAALFAVGLLRTIWKFLHSWYTRGHPGVVHTLLLSWFFAGLVPAVLFARNAPDASLALFTAPAVYILAGCGLHWLYVWLERRYSNTFVVTMALIAFLIAVGVADISNYFTKWARDPAVIKTFAAGATADAQRLNELPPAMLKYVVVPNGTPILSQTIMYLTDTWMPEQQRAKNIYYITRKQFQQHRYRSGAVVVQLDP